MIFHLKIQKQTPVTAESATLSSRFTSEQLIVMDSSSDIYSMLSLAKPQWWGGVKCKIVVKNPFSEQCCIFNACHHQRWTNTLILSSVVNRSVDNQSDQSSGDSAGYVTTWSALRRLDTPRCFITFHHYLHTATAFLPQPGSRSPPPCCSMRQRLGRVIKESELHSLQLAAPPRS